MFESLILSRPEKNRQLGIRRLGGKRKSRRFSRSLYLEPLEPRMMLAMISPFIATPFIDQLVIPETLAPGWRTPDGTLAPDDPLAWSVRETNYAGALPTGDPDYPFISPPGPGVNQQDAIGFVPAIPNLYDQHDGQHQVWPNEDGQNSDRLVGLEGGPYPDPILYHIRDQVAEHSFTSSRVIPITRFGTPVAPEDLPAGVILDENGTAELPYSTIYAFNGTFPGPLINSEYGEPILVRFENDLDLNPLGLDRQDFGDPKFKALTHLHNAHTAPESDGNPAYMQQNGGGYLPGQWVDNLYLNYPPGGNPNEKQSFFWFHDHVHHFTGDNVYKGKVGLNIIYDPDLDPGDERDEGIHGNALHLPGIKTVNPDGSFDVKYDIPMAFFDVQLDDGVTIHDHEDHHIPLPAPKAHPEWWGMSAYVHDANHGFVGDVFTVNGTAFPVLEVAQRQYRFRFLDASVARIYEMSMMTSENGPVAMPGTQGQWQIPDGQLWRPLTQIATMGGLLEAPIERDSIQIWPAGRSEHIVDFSDVPTGTVIYLTNILEMSDGRKPDFNDPEQHVNYAAYKVPMVKIVVGGPPPVGEEGPTSIPTTLRPLPFVPPQEVLDTLPHPEFTAHRSGTFGGANQWLINDKFFDPLTSLHTVTRGEPEVWTFTNGGGGWVHPMHVHMEQHVVLYRELSTNPHPDDTGKSDTVNLDQNESVTFYRNFRTFTGRYVAHCHNLAHEDHSMMFAWTVVEPEIPTSPVSVTIEEAAGQADPTNASPIHFTVVFSEPVAGFETGDVKLSGSAAATTAIVTAADGTLFNTTFDVAVSGMTADGTVNVHIPAGVAQNALAQFNTAAILSTVIFDTTRPIVIIDRHPVQVDPTGTSIIRFRVVFSEPVSGFEPDDVIVTGAAGPFTTDVTGNGTTYTVIVSGTLGAGPVTASIPAGVAQDAAGNFNTASPHAESIPMVVGFAKLVAENAMLSFAPEDFISHYSDSTGDNLVTVRIASLPMYGMLWYEGRPLSAPGLEIPVGDVTRVFYMPSMDFSGYDSFSWDGSDGLAYSGVPAKVGIIVDDADSDIVTEWNQILAAGLNAPYGPQRGGRTLAMMHSAMHDAIMALDGGYDPHYVPASAPAGASMEAAATAAAYTVLYSVFTTPVERDVIQIRYDSHLAAIADGQAELDGIAYGQSVGQAILALRSNDGAAAAMTTPHPDGTMPGEWRRTASGNPMAPGWGNVTPWVITSSDQFDQGGPPALESSEYATDYEEVMTIGSVDSTTRTADQTAAVMFWVDHVPAKWYAVARDISGREGLSLVENARLFELLSLTIADATIAVWDMKYNYSFWRPETAIHEGDNDLNDDTVGDPTWQSLIPAPAFPSYVSGHSTTSAAAAKALELYFGTGDYMFHLGGGHSHGGTAPQPRMFTSFQQAAEEAGMSRIWGGIHFQFENQDGLQAGRELAQYVFEVLGVNTLPSVSDFDVVAEEDVPYVFTAAEFDAAFSDPDALHSLESVQIISLPANGTLALLGTPVTVGQEIFTADLANLTYQGNLDFNGDDAFSWDGSDGRDYSGAPALVNLTVTPVNDPPILSAVGNQSVNEGQELSFTATASDQDLPAQTLTFSLDAASLAAGMTIDAASGEFSWTPTEAQGGANYTVTVTVTDDGTNPANLTASETFTITVAVADRDFGDAPDPAYPTLLASDGARHTIVPGIHLGASVDADADGQPDAQALGDDNDGNDDEDGVRLLTRIVPGTTARLEVTASAPGFLNAWLDLNADGDWDDAGEHFAVDLPLVAGANQVPLVVPANAVVTASTFARFRFSTQAGLDYRGWAPDGEVEDYEVEIQPAIMDDIAGRTSSGHWYVAASTGTSFSTTYWGLWGAGAWTDVQTGDFNGDGQADMVGRLDNRWYVGLSTGTSFVTTYWGLWGAGSWTDVLVGDFNGDGKSDIAGRLNGTRWYVASSTGTSFSTTYWGLWGAGTWTDVLVGDFNADGRSDITARLNGNRWYSSLSTGTSFSTTYWGLWGVGTWTDVGVGDFDGDGRSDIAGRLNDGRWYVGLSTGASFSTTYWGRWGAATWNDVGMGDFDGDGRSDIAGRLDDGRWYVARSDGSKFSNEYWGLWDSSLTWLDVLLDDFAP